MYATPTINGTPSAPGSIDNIDIFGPSSSRIIPIPSKYQSGYVAGEGFPAENENYFMYGITNSIWKIACDLYSIHSELNTVLASQSILPNGTFAQINTAIDNKITGYASNASNLLYGTIPIGRYNASDLLTKILTVDGSGSGLDADNVRGIPGSFFSYSRGDISGDAQPPKGVGGGGWRVITSPPGMLYPVSYGVGFSMSSGTGGGEYTIHLYYGNSILFIQTTVDGGNITLSGWKRIWTETNMGSGSGLQADTVPGYGIGVNNTASIAHNGDLNDLIKGGFFYATYGINRHFPVGIEYDCSIVVYPIAPSACVQTLIPYNTARQFVRVMGLGVFSDWVETLNINNVGNSNGKIPVSNGTLNVNLNADKLDGLDAGNASGNIPVNNGTINVNLNSDKLDGLDAGNASGNIPVNNGTVNANLNADLFDGAQLSTDGTLASNSDSRVPTEKAIRTAIGSLNIKNVTYSTVTSGSNLQAMSVNELMFFSGPTGTPVSIKTPSATGTFYVFSSGSTGSSSVQKLWNNQNIGGYSGVIFKVSDSQI